MATTKTNVITKDYHGKFADQIILRSFAGRTVMSNIHDYSNMVWSLRQRENRSYFRLAVIWAKTVLADEKTYRYYKKKAKGAQTAYNMAISDYMKHRNLMIDMSQCTVGEGGKICFKMNHHFGASSATIILRGESGQVLESGAAKIKGMGYEYKVSRLDRGQKSISVKVILHRGPAEFTRIFSIPKEFL